MIYIEIELYIIELIKKGKLEAYNKLPTEKELINKFKASKMTVRKAITSLVAQGIIFSVKGSGNYVSPLNEYDAMMPFTNPKSGITVRYFNSSTHISDATLDKLKLPEEKRRMDRWFSFVQMFYDKSDHVVGYSMNWIYSEISISPDIVGGELFINFLEDRFMETFKQITDMKFEKTTNRDRAFLYTNSDYTAQKTVYSFNVKHEPIHISIIKLIPEFFEEKSVKSFKKNKYKK